ncbi:MAG TPA: glycosyltransferase family 39 protein [Gammaproteobacteria bacterium]|nr:glycosyltransferase family 39 protein [Gammaproteobacteria bacterium]
MRRTCSELLWGKSTRFVWLFLAAAILLFTCLGSREIWTQEHRWADIVSAMLQYQDYLHPRLDGVDYYDKPLLSYWFIAGLAKVWGGLTTWVIRLPSALAGLLAVWSIYRLGTVLKDRRLGLLAGWMLITTFYFIFWARTSSADMLNLAGTLFAIAWYFSKKLNTSFWDYTIFFLILAVTALCKGLVAPVVAGLLVFLDVMLSKTAKKHLRPVVLFALIPAVMVYLIPFWASGHFNGNQYGENGLMLVYRENVTRYFQPFDHEDPVYSYLFNLPLYVLPWTVFFIPALVALKTRWKRMSAHSKWMALSVILLFLFFTLSGSRRNYYILPVVPFAILMTADWILSGPDTSKRNRYAGRFAVLFYLLFFITFDVGQWAYYSGGGIRAFAETLQARMHQTRSGSEWKIVMLDPESKMRFYLGLSPDIKNYAVSGALRASQTTDSLLAAWPFLRYANQQRDTIFVSRKQYEKSLQAILTHYVVLEETPAFGERILKKYDNQVIAFIPKTS